MLQLKNRTPFAAMPMPLPDRHGVDTVFTVVKGTFTIGDRVALADEQLPVVLADMHYEDPAASSIRVPSDVCLGKGGTDVLLIGSAWAPNEQLTWQMDVTFGVGPITKSLRVMGDRVWETAAGVASATWVAPFVRMPLVWERAFGGTDETEKGPVAEPRNPVGVGFRAAGSTRPLAGLPLPNVEDRSACVSSPRDVPPPAGFAPIAPHWEPRKSFAGTYDEQWEATRAPYLPNDFDPRFFQLAPPTLVTSGHLQGGEPVELHGLTPRGALRFSLPAARVEVAYRVDASVEVRPGVLDTIIVEPDADRLVMIWRAALPCDKRTLRVREIEPRLVAAEHT